MWAQLCGTVAVVSSGHSHFAKRLQAVFETLLCYDLAPTLCKEVTQWSVPDALTRS